MKKTAPIPVGLIGAGRIGRLHAENLAHRIPAARLAAIADVAGKAAKACATDLGVPDAAADYHELLARPDIEAVVICSPTNTHAQIIREAAAAGKHIFCEKPIGLDIKKIDAALAAAEKAGVKLQIGFNRRFDANFSRVRQAVRQGEIGTPQLLHIISRDPAPPPMDYIKVSGGMFMDMTIHDFDMARFVLAAEAEEIYAAAGVTVDLHIGEAGDVDTAIITLKFENGVIGIIDNCRRAVYGYDQRIEVLGTRGAIRTDNTYPNSAVLCGGKHVMRDLPLNFFMERYSESFLAEMRAFVDCVVYDTPPPVTGPDGRTPILMAQGALESLKTNRPVRMIEK